MWRFGALLFGAVAIWLAYREPRRQPARGVPVVDFGGLGGAERMRAVSDLAAAARDVGVVRLVNHGVDVDAARRAAKRYFELPLELKGCPSCSLRNASVGFQRGYIPFAAESGLASVFEVKEGFCYGYEWPAGAPSQHPFQAPNVWPSEEATPLLGEGWRHDLMRFFNDSVRISVAAIDALAEALGDRGMGLAALGVGGDTISQMRMFNYLPPTARCSSQQCMGSSPHTDWHFVTIISRDTASSLEYYDRAAGRWASVESQPGELLLLIGDWLSAFSRGTFHAPAHRVMLPEKENSLSFVLFFYPSIDARLPKDHGELATGSDEVNSVEQSMFELAWGDYVVRKWAQVMSNR